MNNVHNKISLAFMQLVRSFSECLIHAEIPLSGRTAACIAALDRAESSLAILEHAASFSSEERYDAFKIDLAGFRGALSSLEGCCDSSSGSDRLNALREDYKTVWVELLVVDAARHLAAARCPSVKAIGEFAEAV